MNTWKIIGIAGVLTLVNSMGCKTTGKTVDGSSVSASKLDVTSYTCSAGSGKRIKFIPDYGEVHYLKADGSKWQEHDDGLSFDEVHQTTSPVRVSMTITDDEGKKVGSWQYIENSTSFSAKYRNKTYTGCKKSSSESAPTVSYSCPAEANKFIKFLPDYGEVQYLKADGSVWQQHDDGMDFQEVILESNPVQVSMSITDDEGRNLGGWQYVEGAATFSAKYRKKTYTGCKKN